METTIDERWYRAIMGRYPTGVTAITAANSDGRPIGMVVGTFSSVSIDPPLVAFMPTRSSGSYAQLREAKTLCANVLSSEQESVCRAFAVKGADDKFAGLDYALSPGGSPIIAGSVAWIEFSVESVVEAGDHDIVLGRVSAMGEGIGALPLLFLGGGYGGFAPRSRVIPAASDLMQQLRLADASRDEIQAVADRLGLECAAVASVEGSVVRVASAASSAHLARPARIGLRLPFSAPMGGLFVAWDDREVQEEWVRRSSPSVSGTDLTAYLHGLSLVRERGWTLSLQTSAFEHLDARIAESASSNEQVFEFPDLHIALDGPSAFAPVIDVEAPGTHHVRNLSVPVFVQNRVPLYLTVFGFDDQTTTETIRQAIEVLQQAASQVAAKIADVFEGEKR